MLWKENKNLSLTWISPMTTASLTIQERDLEKEAHMEKEKRCVIMKS